MTNRTEYLLLSATRSLVDMYVEVQTRQQLAITVEMNTCSIDKHDVLLPKHTSIHRPSLKDENGVGIFWQNDVVYLRRFYAHQKPIEELVEVLTSIISRSVKSIPQPWELIAKTDKHQTLAFPYTDGDGLGYQINLRYKR